MRTPMRNTATILIQQAVAVPTSFTFRQRLRTSAAVLKRLSSREQTPTQKSLDRPSVNFMRRPWAELLFEAFSQRYERGSTLVTSNLPFEDWTSVLGSERLTGALLDRLTHHVSILTMNGDSYRLRQSAVRHPVVTAAGAEQNQATDESIDPETGEITTG